jgi:hypothetical protein
MNESGILYTTNIRGAGYSGTQGAAPLCGIAGEVSWHQPRRRVPRRRVCAAALTCKLDALLAGGTSALALVIRIIDLETGEQLSGFAPKAVHWMAEQHFVATVDYGHQLWALLTL